MNCSVIGLVVSTLLLGSFSARAAPSPATEITDPAVAEQSLVPPKAPTSTGPIMSTKQGRFVSQDGGPLWGPRLYEALGRPDLAQAYVRRSHVRTGLVLSGDVVIAFGLVAVVLGRGHTICSGPPAGAASSTQQCRYEESVAWSLAGTAAFVGGTAAVFTGTMLMRSDPLTDAEIRSAVDAHNQALRGAVGEATPAAKTTAAFVPSLFDGGGGIALVGAF
jgi:hypothetical protein